MIEVALVVLLHADFPPGRITKANSVTFVNRVQLWTSFDSRATLLATTLDRACERGWGSVTLELFHDRPALNASDGIDSAEAMLQRIWPPSWWRSSRRADRLHEHSFQARTAHKRASRQGDPHGVEQSVGSGGAPLGAEKSPERSRPSPTLAKQAGFSAGMNGRTMVTTIQTIRRDWPHLEWWRAISDDGLLDKDSEHERKAAPIGFRARRSQRQARLADDQIARQALDELERGGRSDGRRVATVPANVFGRSACDSLCPSFRIDSCFASRFPCAGRAARHRQGIRFSTSTKRRRWPIWARSTARARLPASAPVGTRAGIGFRVEVDGKKMPVAEIPDEPTESDGFQLWLDTRNTQSIHRASRFCHHFVFLPGTGGKRGESATAQQLVLSRWPKKMPRLNRAGLLRVASRVSKGGYVLDAWIPAESLHGYDPDANPLLGFYYVVRDAELGEQFLAVGRDFPFDHDPSLWSTLELTR